RYHRWLGFWQMDGAGEFLPPDRWLSALDVLWRGRRLTLRDCHHYWRDLRPAVPARCARLRIKSGLGAGIWPPLLVSWSAPDPADVAGCPAQLVLCTRN